MTTVPTREGVDATNAYPEIMWCLLGAVLFPLLCAAQTSVHFKQDCGVRQTDGHTHTHARTHALAAVPAVSAPQIYCRSKPRSIGHSVSLFFHTNWVRSPLRELGEALAGDAVLMVPVLHSFYTQCSWRKKHEHAHFTQKTDTLLQRMSATTAVSVNGSCHCMESAVMSLYIYTQPDGVNQLRCKTQEPVVNGHRTVASAASQRKGRAAI